MISLAYNSQISTVSVVMFYFHYQFLVVLGLGISYTAILDF